MSEKDLARKRSPSEKETGQNGSATKWAPRDRTDASLYSLIWDFFGILR